jgi:AcrR family transcriptional regulator
LTQFRVKRVALEANISIALLYSYFEDREDLIAATVVYRFRQVLVGLAQIFTTPLKGVETINDLRTALTVMITDAQLPLRTEARILRIESMSFAGHNPTASAGIADAKREASDLIMQYVQPLVDRNLLAPGVTGVAFARIWYALFFGQISLEGEHALSINSGDWLMALQVLAESMVRCDERALVR